MVILRRFEARRVLRFPAKMFRSLRKKEERKTSATRGGGGIIPLSLCVKTVARKRESSNRKRLPRQRRFNSARWLGRRIDSGNYVREGFGRASVAIVGVPFTMERKRAENDVTKCIITIGSAGPAKPRSRVPAYSRCIASRGRPLDLSSVNNDSTG